MVVMSGIATEVKIGEIVPYYPDLPPIKYLEGIELDIVKRIENLAVAGQLTDAVKLSANTTLWAKIRADKTAKQETSDIDESPYDALLRRLDRGE
jgi:hypothetical protein